MWRIIFFVLVVGFFSCSKDEIDFKYSVVKEGNHYSRRFQGWAGYTEEYEFIFTESCRYNLHDGDQGDWNKLFGISEAINTHKISMMWAWRYDTLREVIEIAPYQHDYKLYSDNTLNRQFYNDIVIDVEIGDTIELSIDNKIDSWELIKDNELILNTEKSHRNNSNFYSIFNYFGGNKNAPHDIEILYR